MYSMQQHTFICIEHSYEQTHTFLMCQILKVNGAAGSGFWPPPFIILIPSAQHVFPFSLTLERSFK